MSTLQAEFEAWVVEQKLFSQMSMRRRDMAGSERLGEYVNPLVQFGWLAYQAATERAAKLVPMQPVVLAADGVIRFRENRIVYALLENSRRHGYGLNEAARDDYTPEERMQVAQLIGYSVSGYGSLSYVTDESYEEAERRAAAIRATGGEGS